MGSSVRKIYKQRSQVVRSGRFDLREGLRDKTKVLSARVIFACFELHAALLQETSKKSLENVILSS